jgi:hypothetical protein
MRGPGAMNEVRYDVGLQNGPPSEVGSEPLPCDRCGSFGLLRWSWGRRLCAECLDRQHPALTSGRSFRRVLGDSVRFIPAIGVGGVIAALAPLPFVLALRVVRPVPDTGNERADTLQDLGPTAISGVLFGFVTALLTAALLQVLLSGGRADYRAALRAVARRWVGVLGLSLGLTVATELGSLVIRHWSYLLLGAASMLVYPILLHERVSPITAFMRSAYRLQGQYWRLIGMMILIGIPVVLLFVVPFIALAAVDFLDTAGPTMLVEGLYGLISLPFITLSVALYVKLPPKMILPAAFDALNADRARPG